MSASLLAIALVLGLVACAPSEVDSTESVGDSPSSAAPSAGADDASTVYEFDDYGFAVAPPRAVVPIADELLGVWVVNSPHFAAPVRAHVSAFGIRLTSRCSDFSVSAGSVGSRLLVSGAGGSGGRCAVSFSDYADAFDASLYDVVTTVDGVRLTDGAGGVIELTGRTVEGAPDGTPDGAVLNDLSALPPIPAGWSLAHVDELEGAWVPAGAWATGSAAYLAFFGEGRYVGTDGCNGLGGVIAQSDSGRTGVVEGGFRTLVGCEILDVGYVLAGSVALAERAGRLAMIGPGGDVLMQLEPAAPIRPKQLVGTWHVRGDRSVTVRFLPDGSVVHAACAPYEGGGWVIEPGLVRLVGGAFVGDECLESPGFAMGTFVPAPPSAGDWRSALVFRDSTTGEVSSLIRDGDRDG